MLVRRNSYPNFRLCLESFHEMLSMKCQFVSTRCRGTEDVAPSWAIPLTLMMGRPESDAPDPVHAVVEFAAQSPMLLGGKRWSSGKNPSAKRFQPRRVSF